MHIDEMWDAINRGEPKPEEHVSHYCPNCLQEFCDVPSSIHSVNDKIPTYYIYYRRESTCPDCVTSLGTPVELQGFAENGVLCPHARWELATLLLEKDKLQRKLDDINEELKTYGDYQ